MKKLLLSALITGLLLSGIQPVKAWGPTGHRVVGEIATWHLTPKAKLAIRNIIGNETLAMISNWPDFIKSDTTNLYKHTSPWHYLDFPGHCTRQEFDKLISEAKGENLYTSILAMIKELKDPTTPKARKKFALSFLVHMIGDLHQPLHVGRDEDQGGNKVNVTWFERPTNLHRVWDEHLIDFQQYSYTEYAQNLNRVVTTQNKKAYQTGAITDWMWESHLLSDKVYDRTPEGEKLSYRYNYIFVNDLNGQLTKGGIRLAKVLNDIFK